jgi:hypothetical protein
VVGYNSDCASFRRYRTGACFDLLSVKYRPTVPRLNYVLWIQDIVKTFVLGDEVVRGIDVCALFNPVNLDLLIHEAVEQEPPPYILYWHAVWNQSGPLLLLVSAPRPLHS